MPFAVTQWWFFYWLCFPNIDPFSILLTNRKLLLWHYCRSENSSSRLFLFFSGFNSVSVPLSLFRFCFCGVCMSIAGTALQLPRYYIIFQHLLCEKVHHQWEKCNSNGNDNGNGMAMWNMFNKKIVRSNKFGESNKESDMLKRMNASMCVFWAWTAPTIVKIPSFCFGKFFCLSDSMILKCLFLFAAEAENGEWGDLHDVHLLIFEPDSRLRQDNERHPAMSWIKSLKILRKATTDIARYHEQSPEITHSAHQ